MSQKSLTFNRTHFFIDRKFQGRYLISFLLPMIIMLIFMLCTLYFTTQTMITTTTRTIRSDIENKIALELQDQTNPSVERYNSVISGINDYLKNFSSNKEFRKGLLVSLLWVFGVGILLVIIQIVMLTVFFSHKIAGPVYRFEKVCHEMIHGNYTSEIHLRKGDELKNLASLLNEVIRATRERLSSLKDAKTEEEKKEIVSKFQL